jgi:hypothetical protein
MDGFVGWVKIDKIEICIGKNELAPIVKPNMEMSGEILACPGARLDLFKTKGKTFVGVRINFSPDANSYCDLPDELAKTCVGDMEVEIRDKIREEVSDPLDLDIHARIHLVLNQEVFNSLVILKDSVLKIAPIFFREGGVRKKKTILSESGNVIRYYIKRMHFSPFIERNDD